MLITLIAMLACATLADPCPQKVGSELQLISLPLECFHKLYEPNQFDGNKMKKEVNERLEVYRRMFQELKMQDWEHVKTSPVVKWAQSAAQIFIGFKLSHRQDSPTCSDVRAESFKTKGVNNTEGNIQYEVEEANETSISSFSFRGECYFTSEKLLFTLELDFQQPLSRLHLRKEGLGQYTLIGDKTSPDVWINPFTGSRKAAIWTELRHKYETDMNKYFEILDSQTASTSSKGKRRRRRSKKPETENSGVADQGQGGEL